MLTTLWDEPSLDTAHTTLCFAASHTYPLNFTSLQWGAWRNTSVLIATLPEICEQLGEAFREVQVQSTSEAERQKWYLWQEGPMPFHWRKVTWSWLKLTPTRGRGKWRTGGRRNHMKWNTRLLMASLCTSWKTGGQDTHGCPPLKPTFSHCFCRGDSPLYGCTS